MHYVLIYTNRYRDIGFKLAINNVFYIENHLFLVFVDLS